MAASPSRRSSAHTARDSTLDSGVLRSVVGFHLARASVTTVDSFDRHVGRPLDLRKVEFSVLMLLLANEGVAPKALAQALRISAPKLTQWLDRLQQRGLLQRQPNPADGRSQLIVLTRSGRQLATKAAATAGPMEAELDARLSRAEHAMLIELLGKLAGA